MTHEEIIAMAREAGFRIGRMDTLEGSRTLAQHSGFDCLAEIERFAALVVAKEREACAEIAEKEDVASTDDPFGVQSCIADAIRARGTKEGV